MNPVLQVNCPIVLHATSGEVRKPSAWFISGNSPASWLAELLRWNVPLTEAKLYVLRTSNSRPTPSGVLVSMPSHAFPKVTPRATPFGCEGNRIWLPINAVLSPPLMPEEILIRFPQPQYVWHPGIGLTGFDSFEILSVGALIDPPQLVASEWNQALPAAEINHDIYSIRSFVSLEDVSIFGEEERTIGSEPVQPTHQKNASSGRSLTQGISTGLSNLLRRFAGSAKRETPSPNSKGNGVPAFYQRLTQKLADWLENQRFKAISKLVKDLENDPDEALRRAIPFSSAGDHRGVAPPSGDLGERRTDFDLRKLGGGSPSDRWDIPMEYRLKLQAQYRQLALREKRQGRHRRAAYIYAHLLGDFASAAAELMEGHHFMEAAALFKDHLKQPKAAAECLEKGGLLLEAATLYKKQNLWEKAAEIFDRLEMRQDALECYQRVVDLQVRDGQFPAAAVLLEGKMDQPEAALALLRNGWPDAPTAAACLLGEFDFYVRHSMSEAARKRLLNLPDTPSHLREVFAKLITGLACSFPEEETRKIAKRISFQLIASLMSTERPALMQQAGALLQTLSPDDRLLERDAMRYQSTIQRRQREEKMLLASAFAKKPTQPVGTVAVNSFAVHKLTGCEKQWITQSALASGENLFVISRKAHQLHLARYSWSAPKFHQKALWSGSANLLREPLTEDHAMFVLGSKQKLIVYQRWLPHGSSHEFAETDKLISSFRVEKPAWTENCIAIAATSLGWVSIRTYPDMPWLLTHHDIDGNVLGEFPFPELEIEGHLTSPLLAAHHDHVFIGLGKTLLVHNRREFTHTILSERIHRLTTSSPFATPVCLISLELGASLYWPRTERLVHVDEDLATPAIGFSVAGHVVAIDGETMIVCRTAQESIRYLTKQSWSKARPISVVAGPSPNDFGVVTVENDFVQFRVS